MIGMQLIIFPNEQKRHQDGVIALIWDGDPDKQEEILEIMINHLDQLGFIFDDEEYIREIITDTLDGYWHDWRYINFFMILAILEPIKFNNWIA